MTFPAYSDYRSTGVEWLGQIPGHWNDAQLRRIFRVYNGATPSSGYEEYWGGGIPWVTPDDLGRLKTQWLSSTRRTLTVSGYRSCGTTLVPPNSLIVSTRAPVGYVAITEVDACTNQGCRSLVPTDAADSRYYSYHIRACAEFLQSISGGSTFQELSSSSLSSFRLALPPFDEQQQIADFLDHETARIDALIEEQQRLIRLLQEKRWAAVSHAVTRGIDPDVPLIESDVDWIGRIPSHWRAIQIKRDMNFLTSGPRGWAENYLDHGAVFVRIGNLTRDRIDLDLSELQRVSPPKTSEGTRTLLRPGDLLFSITAYLGSVATVPDNLGEAYISQHLALVRLSQNELMPKWVAYSTLSSVGQNYLASRGYGGTKVQLALDDVANFCVACPPLSGQKEIVDNIEKGLSEMDAVIQESQATIDLLRERRSALISAAVTGKMDVREWEQSTPSTEQILPQAAAQEDRYG